jgi:hypothetical protein
MLIILSHSHNIRNYVMMFQTELHYVKNVISKYTQKVAIYQLSKYKDIQSELHK